MDNTTRNTRVRQTFQAPLVMLVGDTVGAAKFARDRLHTRPARDACNADIVIVATRDCRLAPAVAAVVRRHLGRGRGVLVLAPWGLASGEECSWTTTPGGATVVDMRAVDLRKRWALLLRLGSEPGPACPADLLASKEADRVSRRRAARLARLTDGVPLPEQLGDVKALNSLGVLAGTWVRDYRVAHGGVGPTWEELWDAFRWADRGLPFRSNMGQGVMFSLRGMKWLSFTDEQRSLDAGAEYRRAKYGSRAPGVPPVHGARCGCP